jgi:type IV pilus assembly protein PilO
LQSILPSEKETPTILRSIQRMAEASNLKIRKFTPQPVIPSAFYSDWPIAIELSGGYHGLGSFFEKVSQATRIIDVGTITINGIDKPEAGQTLNASCTATTFVFREDQPPGPDPKGRKEKTR